MDQEWTRNGPGPELDKKKVKGRVMFGEWRMGELDTKNRV